MKQRKEILKAQNEVQSSRHSVIIVLAPAVTLVFVALQLGVFFAVILGTTFANAQQHDVLASRYDDGRTGSALKETLLTPNAVDTRIDRNQFGKLFTYSISGDVYAQPLYVSNVGIPGRGTNNLLLVATMEGFIYALDADGTKAGSDGVFWQRTLGPPPSVADVWRNCDFFSGLV
jgi:hypothetical protein